jgi:hypothetical protein
LLGSQAGGADLVPFPGQAGLAAFLAGQHGDQMDMVIAVPDRDPAHGLVFLTVRRQPGTVHHVMGDGGPLVVAEHPVFWRCAHRAAPHRPRVRSLAEGALRLQEQSRKLGEVSVTTGP